MSSLSKGKHIVSEINGIRCTIIESEAKQSRVDFLKELLEFNKYEVKISENKDKSSTGENLYTIGVTNILFNPVIAVYDRSLKTRNGHKVSPAYWLQQTTICDPRYWRVKR
jgi:hypothetical protein